MVEKCFVALSERGLLAIAGEDRVAFLQGLISNDVTKISAERGIYAAFLTAQGKYLHDFFLVSDREKLLLEGEAARLADLQRRLSIYRLRAKVTLTPAPEFGVFAAFGDGALAALGLTETAGAALAFAGGIAFVDPRLPALGARLLLPIATAAAALAAAGFVRADFESYDRHRLAAGVADGSRDLAVEKTILLEAGFDELNGVDWQKGCYIGQELTARSKYRGLIKKRLLPVRVEGTMPEPGTIITLSEQEAGEMRSGRDGAGLALLRLEALAAAEAGQELRAGEARILPQRPSWLKLPEEAKSGPSRGDGIEEDKR